MVKTLKFIVKTFFFMAYKAACANCTGIKKTSKVRPTSIPKSMKNQCENDGRKMMAKCLNTLSKWSSKRNPNPEKY